MFEKNRSAISKKFPFEKDVMSIAAGLIFTCADREAEIEKLQECSKILKQHTGFFSEYREAVKLALLSEMALSDDAEQYIEDVKAAYQKLHKGHFKDNSFMVLAAMLLGDLGRQNDADAVIEKHNEIMKQMNELHPFLTDSEDISYVILLALSDRPVDAILSDMNEAFDYLKNTCKVKAGADSVQRISEMLALTGGDIKAKCDQVIRLYDMLCEKADLKSDTLFSSVGMLIGMDEEPEVIVSEILDAYEFLKGCKEFDEIEKYSGNYKRLMFAEMLVAAGSGTGTSLIRNAFVNNALAVIKTQQIATKITVIANAVSVVLSAVADRSSTDSENQDAAQTAENEKPEND